MFTSEELEIKLVSELRAIGESLKIQDAKSLAKKELINTIIAQPKSAYFDNNNMEEKSTDINNSQDNIAGTGAARPKRQRIKKDVEVDQSDIPAFKTSVLEDTTPEPKTEVSVPETKVRRERIAIKKRSCCRS